MVGVLRGQGKSRTRDDVASKNWGALSANTFHEYVVHVMVQKYNVTTSRAAGVIQLQHNKEQLVEKTSVLQC